MYMYNVTLTVTPTFWQLLHNKKVAKLGVGSKVSGKSAIFSPLKIGGGEGVQSDFGKIETKDRSDK